MSTAPSTALEAATRADPENFFGGVAPHGRDRCGASVGSNARLQVRSNFKMLRWAEEVDKRADVKTTLLTFIDTRGIELRSIVSPAHTDGF